MPPKKAAPAAAKKPAGGKKATAVKKKAATKAGQEAAPKATQATPEQQAAAVVIQRHARGWLARQQLARKKEKQRKAEEEMETLRAQAYLAEVAYQRKQEEKRRKEAEAERKLRQAEARIRKGMLEAAFDDECDTLEKLMAEATELFGPKPSKKVFGGLPVYDVADANGNTPLSEAAAAGAVNTTRLLLERGAEPNSKGEFGRTPLFRAAFMGKDAVLELLLEGGCDPRITNSSGERPEHIASTAAIKDMLTSWDTEKTDAVIRRLEQAKQEAEAMDRFEAQKALKSATQALDEATLEHANAQKNMRHSHEELERRIFEYDTCVHERKPQSLCEAALSAIKDFEAAHAAAKERLAKATIALQEAKLAVRNAREEEGEEEEEVGQRIELQELDDVIVRDVGAKLRDSGKAPLVIDTSSQASVFFRYADTNYVNACNRKDIEPNRLRRSLLGAIRYGKPCVVDTMGVEIWDEITRALEAVQPGLLNMVLSGAITKPESYMKLVRKEDGDEYDPNKFQEARIQNYRFVVVTSARYPEQPMVDALKPYRINIRSK